MVLLETGRLIVRDVREADFADFCVFLTDENTSRMVGRNLTTDVESARRSFDYFVNKAERGYAIALKQTDKAIGSLTVDNLPPIVAAQEAVQGKKGCALSFSLSPVYRRRGYMYEAVSAIIDRLLHGEGFDFVNCGYFDFNEPSRLLQEKLGFQHLVTYPNPFDDEKFMIVDNILWRE